MKGPFVNDGGFISQQGICGCREMYLNLRQYLGPWVDLTVVMFSCGGMLKFRVKGLA